jgi:hypothetical protein
MGVLIWTRTVKLSKPVGEWWSVGSAPHRYACTARAMRALMRALMEDMHGGVILEPVFMVRTLTLSLCKQTHTISKCFLVIFYERITLLAKNLHLCLFALCFTSYIAQARELALGDMKLL